MTTDSFRNSTADANCGVAPVLASSSSNSLAPARLASSRLPSAVDPAAATPHVCNYTLSRCAPEAPGTSSPAASFERSLMSLLVMIANLVRGFFDLPERLLIFLRRTSIYRSSCKEPVVAFGELLDHRGLIHGGAVKLLSLRDGMSNDEKIFNILYLVSSAQPRFAIDLVGQTRARGIPFVWNQNGVGYPAWAGWQSERQNGPMRWLRERADYIIYQSQFCREAAEKFLGPCSTPGEILFNPVNLKKFVPLAERPSLKPLRLLTLGTHSYAERVFSTLECLKILRMNGVEVTLTIAGKYLWPQGEAAVHQKIQELGLADGVTLLPPFHQEEAIRLYQSHHILLHPKYLDPCPTVVIEALASGCPVVGSASGGLPELISEECGFLIPTPLCWDKMITPTGAQLAEGVMNLFSRWESAATAARARAELLFDEVRWVERHREIFQNLLR
ncbi:MAG: glycosyltransferase family 4 protein [Verrucomicrobiota bacterium]